MNTRKQMADSINSNVCDKHLHTPIKIYNQCVGCELESLNNGINRLQTQVDKQLHEKREVIAELVVNVKMERQENAKLRSEIETMKSVIQKYKKALEVIGSKHEPPASKIANDVLWIVDNEKQEFPCAYDKCTNKTDDIIFSLCDKHRK
ncbi:hypothetical protein [Brevibacillus sp. NRS-1366]|uniref:hypothetical protein n=1 Tax=Brevibacillus sp. NRS-1366 TaxID=3233899 RepID=UPI003D23A25E